MVHRYAVRDRLHDMVFIQGIGLGLVSPALYQENLFFPPPSLASRPRGFLFGDTVGAGKKEKAWKKPGFRKNNETIIVIGLALPFSSQVISHPLWITGANDSGLIVTLYPLHDLMTGYLNDAVVKRMDIDFI